jgi:hypothetical protein
MRPSWPLHRVRCGSCSSLWKAGPIDRGGALPCLPGAVSGGAPLLPVRCGSGASDVSGFESVAAA